MPGFRMGYRKKLPPRSSSGHLFVRPSENLACARFSRLPASAWDNFTAVWLKICVSMPAVSLSLSVGALGRRLRVHGLTCAGCCDAWQVEVTFRAFDVPLRRMKCLPLSDGGSASSSAASRSSSPSHICTASVRAADVYSAVYGS